jgi:hypothetical protein
MGEQKLTRPPESGPGSAREAWVAFAAQELDVPESDFADQKDWTREKIIALVDNYPRAYEGKHEDGSSSGVRVVPEADATKLREAPEGVDVYDDPKGVTDALGRRTWAAPVEGGYADELEIVAHDVEEIKHGKTKAE